MKCINCGRKRVVRTGDDFKCSGCGYTWNVEHEQQNAHYIRMAMGRNPAEPVGAGSEPEPETPAWFDDLEPETVFLDETIKPDMLGEWSHYHFNIQVEGNPLGETELPEVITLDENAILDKLGDYTIPQLRDLAASHDVVIPANIRKDDIIDLLAESGKLTVIYSANDELLDVV